jgi:uncharacterized membrane protein YidH (DUF202 family)
MNAEDNRSPGGPVETSPVQRVELAWHRSGLAFAAIGAALLRRELPNVPARPAGAVALIAVGSLAALVAVLYRERLRRHPISRRMEILLVAIGAVGLGMVAFSVSIIG